ncbi:IS1 family transposase [bacterium]|nr:IS1 family transposase [bacterium]
MLTLPAPNATWQPPFCPNPNCRYHRDFAADWPWKRHGYYWRQLRPHRIQRFQCRACRRSFSTQTFSTGYWLKRPDVLPQLFMKTVGAMANRQIARELAVAPSTVDRQLERLGRHCLLLHQELLAQCRIEGPVAVDGFESFEYSQYFPFHHNLAVEVETSFGLGFTTSPLRRKGRMRPDQKRRRAELEAQLGRPDPKAIERGMGDLLQILAKCCARLQLRSDEHPAYPRALRGLGCSAVHRVTSSTERRDTHNPLFEVNLLDLLIRHSSANHRRETIAWSKRRNGSSLRLAILLVWRNLVKRRWEKGPPESPAMLKGLADHLYTATELLAARRFPSRIEIEPVWVRIYTGDERTPALSINRGHRLRYAT